MLTNNCIFKARAVIYVVVKAEDSQLSGCGLKQLPVATFFLQMLSRKEEVVDQLTANQIPKMWKSKFRDSADSI
jgi:hypothetical protein